MTIFCCFARPNKRAGRVAPLNECAAVAVQQRQVYAQLVAREGERLTDLLGRLDAAVAKAIDEDIYTDEINRWTAGKTVLTARLR